MKSLLGGIGSALAGARNSAPVPYVGARGTGLVNPGGFGSSGGDATSAMEAMGSVSILFSIVNKLATATSMVDWRLWRKAKSGLPEDRTEVTTHPALEVWNTPNKFYTRQELVETEQQHIELTGEGWTVISRAAGWAYPLELWPARPDRMTPIPHRENFLAGYMYRGPDNERVPLDLDEVMQIRMPNPLDPYRGIGPVGALLTDLDSYRYSGEWNRNFFLNSAEPGGIIEIPEALSDTEFENLRNRWNDQHRGVTRAHRVALLEHGKWVDRKYSMRDMEFSKLRGLSREIIREGFGIHKHILGASDDVNRANAEAASVDFARWLLVPRLERWKLMLNNDFLPMFGPNVTRQYEFDYVNPVPEDRELENAELTSRTQAFANLVREGVPASQAAEVCGLPPLTIEIKAVPVPAIEAPPIDEPMDRIALDVISKVIAYLADREPVATPPTALPAITAEAAPPTDMSAQVVMLQAEWQTALDELLAEYAPVTEVQRAALLDQIRTAVDRNDFAALSTLTVSAAAGAAVITAAMLALAVTGAASVVREAAAQGVTDVHPGEVDESALGEAATAVATLLATGLALAAGREALRLATPDTHGDEVADQVRVYLEGLSDRALRDTLGGALTRAQNTGRIATMKTAPVAEYWASEENDTNTCQPCRLIDAHRFADLADAEAHYPAGLYYACLGRERCRGTFVAYWS